MLRCEASRCSHNSHNVEVHDASIEVHDASIEVSSYHEEANVCTIAIVAGNVDHQVHRMEATRGVIYNLLNKHEWIIKYGRGR